MVRTIESHVEHVLQVAENVLPRTPSLNSEVILRSWQRCANDYKLDPSKPHRPYIETAQSLACAMDRLGTFLDVARAGLRQLAGAEADYGYVILTDANGVIVDAVDTGEWLRDCEDAGLLLGANWDERHAGTNGIGTCLVERTPLSCGLEDHFHTSQLGLSCSSMPLFAPEGSFIGVLNVSALSVPNSCENLHLAPHLARQYARLIENANFASHFNNCWMLRLATASELLEISSDVLLAINEDGVIVGANSSARRLLERPNSEKPKGLDYAIVDQHLTSVFDCGHGDVWFLTRQQNAGQHTVLRTRQNLQLVACASQPKFPKSKAKHKSAVSANISTAISRLAGEDAEMARVLDQAQRLVNKNIHILLQGETGSGKEVLARALHDSSARAKNPFIAVNCAAIPETLIESELFGYAAGAFTGARSKGMQGLIERSSGGTLFLDEIGDMPIQLQTRLLRVLSENEVQPLASDKNVSVNLTVISASHRDLKELVAAQKFREDLYYRLCGATLHLPGLRDRQDKDYIIQRILQQEAQQLGASPWIDEAAMDLLRKYQWPGNVRELRNVIRFALAISDDGILVEHLPPILRGVGDVASRQALSQAESLELKPDDPAGLLRACLRKHKWNITAVASELDLCRTSVYRQMKRFGIVPPTHL